jgi:hypothetical protein
VLPPCRLRARTGHKAAKGLKGRLRPKSAEGGLTEPITSLTRTIYLRRPTSPSGANNTSNQAAFQDATL